jgi:hypothetical protein
VRVVAHQFFQRLAHAPKLLVRNPERRLQQTVGPEGVQVILAQPPATTHRSVLLTATQLKTSTQRRKDAKKSNEDSTQRQEINKNGRHFSQVN